MDTNAGSLNNVARCCVLVASFAWLAACSGTTAPVTNIPVTIVFDPASEGVNPPLPSGDQPPPRKRASNGTLLDASTPAPPSDEVKTFTSAYGVSFNYPANWFTFLKEAENVVVVLNAPPDGIYALKQGGDFRAIAVGLHPEDIAGYESVRAYMEATLLQQCFECKVLAVEELPLLKQGYTAMQVTYLGEGERAVLFVTNGQRLIKLSTAYAPGKRIEARYLEVLDQIANTLVIP